jgi:hypothetical protein
VRLFWLGNGRDDRWIESVSWGRSVSVERAGFLGSDGDSLGGYIDSTIWLIYLGSALLSFRWIVLGPCRLALMFYLEDD